ncbi:hypothetical protein [Streptomyces sp. NPDC127066]|uniref:hypothetical protein n=1 Tax=Streptomyces sp. NPDC127066 TaxID=3347125 RepID=UPI00365F1886
MDDAHGPLVDALSEHLIGDLGRYALENSFRAVVEGAVLARADPRACGGLAPVAADAAFAVADLARLPLTSQRVDRAMALDAPQYAPDRVAVTAVRD